MRTIANMIGYVRLEKDSNDWYTAEIQQQPDGLYCAKIENLCLCDISENDIKLNLQKNNCMNYEIENSNEMSLDEARWVLLITPEYSWGKSERTRKAIEIITKDCDEKIKYFLETNK